MTKKPTTNIPALDRILEWPKGAKPAVIKKPPSEVTKLAKAITRDARVSRIDLSFYPGERNWSAAALPESFIAHRKTTAYLKSLERMTTLDELTDAFEKFAKQPLACASGKTAEETLAALRDALAKVEEGQS